MRDFIGPFGHIGLLLWGKNKAGISGVGLGWQVVAGICTAPAERLLAAGGQHHKSLCVHSGNAARLRAVAYGERKVEAVRPLHPPPLFATLVVMDLGM